MLNSDISWYHEKLSREAAENLLLEGDLILIDYNFSNIMFIVTEERPNGCFLVRDSNSSSGDFVLSVRHNNDISHFQIRRHAEDAFFSIGKYWIILFLKIKKN